MKKNVENGWEEGNCRGRGDKRTGKKREDEPPKRQGAVSGQSKSNSPLSFHDFPSLEIEGIGAVGATVFIIPASTPSRFDSTSFAVHRKNLMP